MYKEVGGGGEMGSRAPINRVTMSNSTPVVLYCDQPDKLHSAFLSITDKIVYRSSPRLIMCRRSGLEFAQERGGNLLLRRLSRAPVVVESAAGNVCLV